MLYKTLSAAVYSFYANIIEVEVDVSAIKTNEDHFHTIGLPNALEIAAPEATTL